MNRKIRSRTGRFSDEIRMFGTTSIPHAELGYVLAEYPIIGGGAECIVIRVGSAIVRLLPEDDLWVAAEIVERRAVWEEGP